MVEFIRQLSPEQQAALAGALVSALYALYKWIAARAGQVDESAGAKAKQLLGVLVTTGLAALVTVAQSGALSPGRVLVAWLMAFLGAQSAYGVVKSLGHVGAAVASTCPTEGE